MSVAHVYSCQRRQLRVPRRHEPPCLIEVLGTGSHFRARHDCSSAVSCWEARCAAVYSCDWCIRSRSNMHMHDQGCEKWVRSKVEKPKPSFFARKHDGEADRQTDTRLTRRATSRSSDDDGARRYSRRHASWRPPPPRYMYDIHLSGLYNLYFRERSNQVMSSGHEFRS